MTKLRIVLFSAAMLPLLGSFATAATVNAFANGSFEIAGADPPPAEGWVEAANGYSLSTDALTGSFSAELASAAFGAAVMLQNSVEDGGQPQIQPGDDPDFSFWSKGFAGGTGNVLFSLRYLDDVGNILYNSNNVFFQGDINPSTWTEITFDPPPIPAGAVAAFVEFSQGIGPIDNGNPAGQVLIDDVYLGVTAIPEPTSIAMIAAAGLGLLVVARKRR